MSRLSILNDPPSIIDRSQYLHHLIQWKKNSERIAIDFLADDGTRWTCTYGQLRVLVAGVAAQIQTTFETLAISLSRENHPENVGEEHHIIIPVLLPQSPGLYIAILAILEYGAAFCPVNIDSPPERVKFVTADVKARLVITTERCRVKTVCEKSSQENLIIEEYPTIPSYEPSETTGISPQSGKVLKSTDLAYVMYTSGSSGTPKGVQVSHFSVAQSLLAHDTHIPSFARFLQFAAPSFDVSVFEIFFPLFRGATLVGCDRGRLLNNLMTIINELEVDAAELTPTVVSTLVQNRQNVPHLNLLLTIGEMLTRSVIDNFGSSETREGILCGMYGPTEAAIHCTINPNLRVGDNVGNIGFPLSTVSTFICAPNEKSDPQSEPQILPLGEVGELVLMGPQLADGYLNRPDQSSAAFVTLHGKPAYRTGDKGMQLENGTIEIYGRIASGQVKLHGQRVELGEIEATISKHENVQMAVVAVVDQTIVAWAVTKSDSVTKIGVLKTCKDWLPRFMIPSEIILIQSLPFLPSGKVDKRRLEETYRNGMRPENTVVFDAPSSLAGTVRKTVETLLKLEIQYTTDLASVGLDSLKAIRLASMLREAGLTISSLDIVQADTLASLIHMCEERQGFSEPLGTSIPSHFVDSVSSIYEQVKTDNGGNIIDFIIPCTPIQDGLIAVSQANSLAYNNRIHLRISGRQDFHQIQNAIRLLASHNSVLRSGFVECSSNFSTFALIVEKDLPLSQVVLTDEFLYDVSSLPYYSLRHPFYVQVKVDEDSTDLLIFIHHAIYDGWSLDLILDDLDCLLEGLTPATRPQFVQVVSHYLSEADRSSSSIDYWQDHLSGFTPTLLPNFHTTLDSTQGSSFCEIDAPFTTSELRNAAEALSVSMQSLFQAAFAVILSSYLGNHDVCFGTVFSGRTSEIPSIEDVVGPCFSTLPVRVDAGSFPQLSELAKRYHLINRNHLHHSSTSLREIKTAIGIEPGIALFDALLVWQETLQHSDRRRTNVEVIKTKDYLEYKLTLEITPTGERISLSSNYNGHHFPIRQCRLLLQQVSGLLEAMIRDPNVTCRSAVLGLEKGLISIDNSTPSVVKTQSLCENIERIALEDADRIAIEFANSLDESGVDIERVSYSDLNMRANNYADYLISLGALPNELIMICMEKCVDLYVSILGVIKAGGGYLPIALDAPVDRILKAAEEADIHIVITQSLMAKHFLHLSSVKLIFVDEPNFKIRPLANASNKAVKTDLAYCVFTSGSTGTPKGVLISRLNLTSNLQVLSELYPHDSSTKLLQSCSQAFDVSVFEIFFSWYIGATLCSGTKDVLFRDLPYAINKMGITHLSLTPTVASLLKPSEIPKVIFLVTAGEAVTGKVFESWTGHGLWQGYGPSETTNICTVRPRVTAHNAINNIGRPLKNTSVFVLAPETGDQFSPVPRGAEGELCFGGEQVGCGYLGDNQTQGGFFQHPEYGRLYRSGDFGRLLPDGSLSFSGRKDDQVKIRGHRIELGEVCAVLLRQSEVKDCVALIATGVSDMERILVFWTPHDTVSSKCEAQKPDLSVIKSLFDALAVALPSYMIPYALVPISCIPSTSQGKVDKRYLARLFESQRSTYVGQVTHSFDEGQSHEENSSYEEMQISKLVAKALNIKLTDVRPAISLFSIGLDSFSAIALTRLLREELGASVKISDVLKNPSVRRLSKIISLSATNAEGPSASEFITQRRLEDFLDSDFRQVISDKFFHHGRRILKFRPCTPLQEAMLSAAMITPDKNAYANHMLFSIKIPLPVLQRAWRIMIERHEILRTCFISTNKADSFYAQVVIERAQHEIFIEDGTRSADDVKNRFNKTTANHESWNLPYRTTIINTGEKIMLLISMHHALYDGIALSVLLQEIETMIEGRSLQPAINFDSFLNYQANIDMTKADLYWKGLLRGLTPTLFSNRSFQDQPSGVAPRPEAGAQDLFKISLLESSSSFRMIDQAAKTFSATFLSICQGAWAVLLSRHLNRADVCFGDVISGRSVPIEGIDRLVAPCFNTIPTRARNLHQMTYKDLFRDMRNQNSSSFPHHLTPLRRIQSQHGRGRLFDTLLILQPKAVGLNPNIWTMIEDSGTMDMPIVLEITPRPVEDKVELKLHMSSSIREMIDQKEFLAEYDHILLQAILRPDDSVMSASARNSLILASTQILAPDMSVETSSGNILQEQMSELELEIQDVFSELSRIPRQKIVRSTTILSIGLDSLNAIQVATKLRSMGKSVVATDILEHSSVGELAVYITNTSKSVAAIPAALPPSLVFSTVDSKYRFQICKKLGISPEDLEKVRPCTNVQAGMLAATLQSIDKSDDSIQYVNSFQMQLEPGTNVGRLLEAWTNTTKEVEILRTAFVSAASLGEMVETNGELTFLMVTYQSRGREIAIVDSNEDSAAHVIKNLSSCTWNLQIIKTSHDTSVKFTAHHAIYDAQSLESILAIVANHYQSLRGAHMSCPSFDPLLTAIVAAEHAKLEEKEEFWSKDENKIHPLRFPDLNPLHVSIASDQISEKSSMLDVQTLDTLCRSRNVSIQVAGQAAWARILAAYTSEPQVTFATTFSGRSILEGSPGRIFPSIVTLPISCSLTGTNNELLKSMMTTTAQVQKLQSTSWLSIRKWAGGIADTKLIDSLFVYQKLAVDENRGQRPWKIMDETAVTEYAVSMELVPDSEGQILLRLIARAHILPGEQARILLRHFDAFLRDTLVNGDGRCLALPTTDVGLLSILPPEQPLLPAPVDLLHQFVEMQAGRNPNKTALEFTTRDDTNLLKSKTWTYKELDAEGDKIANLVLRWIDGLEHQELVAICFDKCPEASFAILGILKAGMAYVALDPGAPPDRIRFILNDCKAKLVLSSGKEAEMLISTLSKNMNDVAVMDLRIDDIKLPTELESFRRRRSPASQDTCYCLYTSGTTGTPKGCEITHLNAVQAMMAFQHLFRGHWKPTSKWLQFASFHFDVSVLEQFWSWGVGICVSSAPRDLIFQDIPGIIRQLGITHIDLTPSLARLVHPNEAPSLIDGVFITGGEQLKQEILDEWGPERCIYNGYGPTEATIGVTMYQRVPASGKPANIGAQFLNVGSYVLHPGTEEPVLRGAIGELCVSGVLVGKGYLNRPELTRERFPIVGTFKERVYRTGDLVRMLHNRQFLFVGRADDQVKLRGQRLELAEINEVMRKNVDNVKEVAAVVLKHRLHHSEQIIAFFVPTLREKDEKKIANSLHKTCERKLPRYMIPSQFIPIDEMPLSANNKADFKRLGQIYNDMTLEEIQRCSIAETDSSVWTEEERKILQIMADYTKIDIDTVGKATNVFQLGVDSISVLGIQGRFQKHGYFPKLTDILIATPVSSFVGQLALNPRASTKLDHMPAIQRIAAFSNKWLFTAAKELQISPSCIERIAPCTSTQEGMVYQLLTDSKASYENIFNFELGPTIDQGRLSQSWKVVTLKLQILRTKFLLTEDGVAQVVLDTKHHEDHIECAQNDQPCACRENKVTNDSGFGYGNDPSDILKKPWHVSFSVQKNGTRTMSLQIFHGLYDGVSLDRLLSAIAAEYSGESNFDYGPSFHSALPRGPLAMIDNIKARLFFESSLMRWEPSELSADQSKRTTGQMLTQRRKFGNGILDQLRQVLGVTDQAILQALWATVLQSLTQCTNVTFGVVVSGRSVDVEGIDRVIGPLLNIVPFSVSIDEKSSWMDIIKSCHEQSLALLPWCHTPLKDIQKWISNGQPLFDSLFVFQNNERKRPIDLWHETERDSVLEYPIAFDAQINSAAELEVTLIANNGILSKSILQEMLQNVETMLKSMQASIYNIPSVYRSTSNPYSKPTPDKMVEMNDGKTNQQSSAVAIVIRKEIETLARVSITNDQSSVFELGLDSIDLIKLSARLKRQKIELSVSTILMGQTVANLIRLAKLTNLNGISGPKTMDIEAIERKLIRHFERSHVSWMKGIRALPATPLQEGIASQMLESNFTKYFNHELFEIDSSVDISRLKRAWNHVIASNDVLRARLLPIDEISISWNFAQIISMSIENAWHEEEVIENDNLENTRHRIVKRATERIKRTGEPLQLTLIVQGNRSYFMLSISHAIYDGWSLRLLHQDVHAFYFGVTINRPDAREVLPQVFNSCTPAAATFWQSILAGSPSSTLTKRSAATKSHRHELTSSLSLEDIRAFCRFAGCSIQALGQTAWAFLLATHLRQLDVVFGAVLSGRDSEEMNEVMFPLMNTVAMRVILNGSNLEMVKSVQSLGSSIKEYQHFPLSRAKFFTKIEGSLFDTLFIYQGQLKVLRSEQPLYRSIESISDVEFNVCVEMEIVGGHLMFRTACRDGVFTSFETEALLKTLDMIMAKIIESPQDAVFLSSPRGIAIAGLEPFLPKNKIISKKQHLQISGSKTDNTWTDTEKIIRAVLAEVSKIPEDEIAQYHSIFNIGLDSITAIKVSAALYRKSIAVSVADMVQGKSIATLASLANGQTTLPSRSTKSSIEISAFEDNKLVPLELPAGSETDQRIVECILPATAGQVYMLARWCLSKGTLFFGEFKFEVPLTIGEDGIYEAWKILEKRHPILRTHFEVTSDPKHTFVQVILKEPSTTVLRSSEDNINLKEPILRFVQRKSNALIFVIKMHHALYDARSLQLILDDLSSILSGKEFSSRTSSLRFSQLATELEKRSVSSVRSRQKFWSDSLSGFERIERQPASSSTARVEIFRPSVLIEDLRKRARTMGVSVDAIVLSAFSQAYSEHFQNNRVDVLFGLYLANRAFGDLDLSNLASPTLNLLPLRVNTSRSVLESADSIQADLAAIGASEIVGTNLEEIYEWTGVTIDCFVNILKDGLDAAAAVGPLSPCGEDIRREKKTRKYDLKPHHDDFADLDSSLSSKLAKVYISTVDIELRITEEGKGLDIGVFGPAELLSIENANLFVAHLQHLLQDLG